MTSMLFDVPVTLIKRGEKIGQDELGDPVYGESHGVEYSGWVERSGNTEDIDNRSQLTTLYTLWLDGHVDISGYDSVRYGPYTYSIQGEPGFQPGGTVVPGFTFAPLKRVTG